MDHWFPLSAKAGEKMKGSGENAFFRNARNYNQWDELYNGLAYHTGGDNFIYTGAGAAGIFICWVAL